MTMASVSSVDLAGRRVLVVEDQFVIAMDMEQMLRALGADAIDLATSIADALATIERTPPDLAILDVKLGAETTAPIAEALQARAIPLIFVTGYGDLAALPPPLRQAPFLRKPVERGALAGLIGDLLRS
jgi:CheY-like chemotaxis protein